MIKSVNKLKKGQLGLYVVLLLAVIALMVTMRHCDGKPATVAAGDKRSSGGDTIDVAIEYSPVTYYTYADTLGGYCYDLMRLISAYAHRPVKFHSIVSLTAGMKLLDEGFCDVLVAQYPLMRSNKGKYLFTDPIFVDSQVLVQRRGGNGGRAVKSQLDLAGDTVHIVANSPMAERISSLGREIGDTIHVVADPDYGPEQLVMMVAAGEVQYAVVNRTIARELARRINNIDVSVPVSMQQFQPWVLPLADRELCDSINSWHRTVARTSAYSLLRQRYFGN